MPNTQWRIAYGDYDFAIDRQTLAYSLTETKTGTVWADGLSTGWIELEERESGARTRYNFADAKLISVAEKSSHQGKRILFGLDLLGIPIDLYFICSEKEVQLTVEANRDTKTHKVQDVGLLPGLVSVPDDCRSCFVLPHADGVLISANDVPETPRDFDIWNYDRGVSMPFVGAVRDVHYDGQDGRSALAVITDSAYGTFRLSQSENPLPAIDTVYRRDPQRRRLDLRINVLPEGDYIAVARTYREKVIADRNHVTLRKKMRDSKGLDEANGAAFLLGYRSADSPSQNQIAERESIVRSGMNRAPVISLYPANDESIVCLLWPPAAFDADVWDAMEMLLADASSARSKGSLVCAGFPGDWCAIAVDIAISYPVFSGRWISVPLLASVYHDSVIFPEPIPYDQGSCFLRALRHLAPPSFGFTLEQLNLDRRLGKERRAWIGKTSSVLAQLHSLTFSAFLTEHHFVTPDFTVEEAVYSDKTRVLINQSKTDHFEREDVALPPGGFYVRHAQMEAHYALRVGDVTFDKPAWRIRRSNDGKPLETSEDILTQEFPV